MSTHLYLAPAASGKTRWVIDALRQSAARLQGTPVAVVATPLQAGSLRARLAGAGGALGVHILTFDELYVLLLGHCGGVYTELAEPVRFRLLRGVLDAANTAGRLPFYGGLAGSAGFVHIVQGLIGLFKGATITPEALAAALAATLPPGNDGARLHELALLYADYQQLLQEQGWSDRAGMGWLALEAVRDCDQPLPPAVQLLVFDGFDSFTEIQLQVIAALAAKLPRVVVTLTGDVRAANGEVEARPEQRLYIRTARQLCAALRVRAEPLPTAQPAPEPQVEMIEATNQAAEVRAALRWLKQRIVQDGCRAEDVALLARSLQPYRETAVQVAAEFGIPLRILDGLPLAQNPAVAALLDLLHLARPAGDGSGLDLPRRGVLEAWRSPYFDWGSSDEGQSSAADLLLNVALEGRVIRGEGQWREALAQYASRSAVPDEDAAGGEPAGDDMGAAALAAQFDRFVAAITPPPQAATLAAFTRWLEQLIGDDKPTSEAGAAADDDQPPAQPDTAAASMPPAHDLPHLLACVRAAAPETASRDLAALVAFKDVLRGLIWAELAAAQLGATQPPVTYTQFLDELVGTVNVAHYQPPTPSAGAVLVGTAAQVRGVPLAAAAVIGLAEGEFPARISEDPFLRDADRLRLRAQGLPLELSTVSYERELFADSLARAGQRLLLTRPRLAEGGAEWEPSPFWREQRQLRHITPLRLLSSDLAQPPASAQELVERLARRPTPAVAALAWLQKHFAGRWQGVQAGAHIILARHRRQLSPFDGDLTPLAPALAAAYGAAHVWSPSRLESYLTCGFMFFTGSVLRFAAREVPGEGLDAAQLGAIYHRIFEQVYRSAADPSDLAALQAGVPAIAAAVLAAAPQELGFRATAWWAQECAAIQERVQQTLAGLHANGGDRYLPIAFEQRFGSEGNPLGIEFGGETLYVRGMIDRVDRHMETGKLRVIDYKTGSIGFDAGGLRNGKKLQLPLYALAAQAALGLGEVEEGFYWLIGRGEPSSLQLSRWPGGPAGAIAAAAAHVQAAAQSVRAGQFAGHAPADGCPSYCPAAAFCAHYRVRG
jgi:ATP-dependent helicase/nuclease subunit B